MVSAFLFSVCHTDDHFPNFSINVLLQLRILTEIPFSTFIVSTVTVAVLPLPSVLVNGAHLLNTLHS